MSAAAEEDRHEAVRKHLFLFLSAHTEEGAVTHEEIDEIIVSYVVSVVEEVVASPDSFDAESFLEMITAYIPNASSISPEAATEWMMRLVHEEEEKQKKVVKKDFDLKSVIQDTAVPKSVKSPRTPKVSEGDDQDLPPGKKRVSRISESGDSSEDPSERDEGHHQRALGALLEMFPYACSLEATHCLRLSAGDVEAAAQLVMHRHEAGQSLRPQDAKKQVHQQRPASDDKQVKDRILGKYGFVDQEEDQRYHRPTLRNEDDKKLIRYRDGKIVSTKGERFTQVSKQESEELKKSIVNNNSSVTSSSSSFSSLFY